MNSNIFNQNGLQFNPLFNPIPFQNLSVPFLYNNPNMINMNNINNNQFLFNAQNNLKCLRKKLRRSLSILKKKYLN